MAIQIYGISSCSTVKRAAKWFEAAGCDVESNDFRRTPVSLEKVSSWVKAFGAKAMKNTSGGSYRALGTEKDQWDDAQWAHAFAQDVMLIKRPVIEKDGVPLVVGFRKSDEELRSLFGLEE